MFSYLEREREEEDREKIKNQKKIETRLIRKSEIRNQESGINHREKIFFCLSTLLNETRVCGLWRNALGPSPKPRFLLLSHDGETDREICYCMLPP